MKIRIHGPKQTATTFEFTVPSMTDAQFLEQKLNESGWEVRISQSSGTSGTDMRKVKVQQRSGGTVGEIETFLKQQDDVEFVQR